MKDAYTAKEIAEAKKVTDRAVRERADRESWSWQKRVVRGGGKEFLAHSLPDDIRSALALREAESAPPPALPGAEAVIPDWTHRIALDRYRVVHAWREHAKTAKGKKISQTLSSFLMLFNTGTILPEVRERLDEIGDKTLYRWDKLLRDQADDYRALADRRGKWRQGGPQGLGQIGPRAEQVFLQLYLQPNRPSIQLAYNGMASMLAREELPVPSYPSTARFWPGPPGRWAGSSP